MSRPVRITQEFIQNSPTNLDPLALYTVVRRPTLLALQLAIEKAGSEAALARQLGLTQQAINKWKHFGRDIPMARWERLIQIAEHGELV